MPKKLILLFIIAVMAPLQSANGEVKHDGSLGTSGNVQGPNYSIEAAMGKQMGSSLFHSFEKFDINTGENATFKGPSDVERIISRVTGGNPSRIDGAIRSDIQGADFYLINPFGMIFGPNASLDITGSFFATSADYVKLGENGRFDARNPENTVLTADAPEAFGFLGQKPGNITIESKRQTGTDAATGKPTYSGLEVNGDSRLMLAGGDIKIDNGIVQTHSGNLDIAAVSSAGELDIESPDVKAFESLGKLEVLNEGHVYSKGGGNIECQAGSVEIFSNSDIETSALVGIPKAGDVTVNARSSVTVSGSGGDFSSTIGSIVNNISDAGCGNVFIKAADVNISDGAIVYSYSSGSGDSGNIILDVARLRLLDGGNINASIYGGNGKSGDIDITATESVNISGFYQKDISVYSSGVFSRAIDSENASGGKITINAPGVVIENNGVLSTESWKAGDSGNIILDVAWLRLLNGGQINASIEGGKGKSGDIDITATESVNISGFYQGNDSEYLSGVFSRAIDSENASGGKISVNAPEVVIENRGIMTTSSSKAGDSGNIILDVARLRLLAGGRIDATISGGKGKSGDVDITATESVNISGVYKGDDSYVGGVASGAMNSENAFGGKISVKAPDVVIENKGLLITESQNAGGSGNIFLDVAKLRLLNGGLINASISGGKGKAGDIDITATESVNISGFYNDDDSDVSGVFSKALNSENAFGGKISVKAPDVFIENKGLLTTKSTNAGDSGDIILDVARLCLLDRGSINASIGGGKGKSGDIDITATESVNVSSFYQGDDSEYLSSVVSIAYDSENAFGGKISVNAPEVVIEKRGFLTTGSINAGDSGNIILDVARLRLLDGGGISASIGGGKGKSGDIDITATEFVNISGFYEDDDSEHLSGVSSKAYGSKNAFGGKISVNAPEVIIEKRGVLATGSINAGDSGNIILDVAKLRLLDGGKVNASIEEGKGKSGDIDITASEFVNISGFYESDDSDVSGVFSTALNSENAFGGKISVNAPEVVIEKRGFLTTGSINAGDSGNIILDVARLRLLDAGFINATINRGKGKSGDIDITATESVNISGFYKTIDSDANSGVFSKALNSENAFGGKISVNAPDLLIANKGILTSGSFNAAGSGNISLNVARLRLLYGGWINASISGGKGKSGDIDITATEFVNISGFYQEDDSDVSGVLSIACDSENAFGGKISVNAPDVVIENRGILTTESWRALYSGNIILDVARLRLVDGGCINASIYDGGNGKSGDIDITATEFVNISGFYEDYDSDVSGIVSQASASENAPGGAIHIFSPETEISNGGTINCSSRMAGPAGNISIEGERFLNFSGSVDTSADSSGGGNIFFNINDLFFMDNNASVSTSVLGGAGSGGNIKISDPALSVLRNSSIKASAIGGNGGNIDIAADYFIKDKDSILNASSEIGLDGNIDINSPEIDLNSGLIKLAEGYQDPTSFIKDPCIGRMEGKSSSLTYGSLLTRPKNPYEYFESSNQRY